MTHENQQPSPAHDEVATPAAPGDKAAPTIPASAPVAPTAEIGGPTGPEPTRYGDWEKAGRCIDF